MTKRGPQSTKALQATAYHEAGHVVAALDRKIPFRYVTIEQHDGSLGHVAGGDLPFDPEADCSDRRTKEKIENLIFYTLAGGEAERAFAGRSNHAGAKSDYGHAVRLAECLYGNPEVRDAYLRFQVTLTRNWVKSFGPARDIRVVAEALLKHRKLSRAAVRKALREEFRKGASEIAKKLK